MEDQQTQTYTLPKSIFTATNVIDLIEKRETEKIEFTLEGRHDVEFDEHDDHNDNPLQNIHF